MTFSLKPRVGMAALVAAATVVVIAFAVLQYRWNRDASDATGVRLADSLQLSMVNWHLDLFHNLSEACLTMRAAMDAPSGGTLQPFVARFEEWLSIARYPTLIARVDIVRWRAGSAPETLRLNSDSHRFEPVPWPADFNGIRPALEAGIDESAVSGDGRDRPRPETFYTIGAALRDWRFDPGLPALVRPMTSTASSPGHDDWIVIVLDDDVLRNRLLPDLAHRYFQGTDGLDYEVAVAGPGVPRRVIYASDAGFGAEPVRDADGRLNIFGRPLEAASPSALYLFQPTSEVLRPASAVGVSWFPLLAEAPVDQDWQLVVRHRRGGSLGAFVGAMRQRGLIVSYGALLLLVVSMSMLVVASNRAQRLAQLQMDFVTAVSHELRTPLAIIESAADNVAAGVVEGKAQLREYGTVIGHQVGQLSAIVERILLFAAMQDGRHRFLTEPLKVTGIIDAALASTDALIRAGQFTVDRDVDPGLPDVMGDRVALSQCLENLITNALKYGTAERWIGIRARAVVDASGRTDVQISVSDRGIGIAPVDLPQVFEPFYRSASVRAAQIHGTGLGLALARQIAEAMGGTLDVTSVPGRGSTFTLHLFTSPLQPS